jgi:hypothetical protein
VGDFRLDFDADSVLAGARERTGGLSDFGETPFAGPLGILVHSLAADGMLNGMGKAMARERLTRHAVNRLNYVEDRKRNPGIARERIVKPVFIIGFPRTGTTILHDILAQDPANRAPLTWEVMFPSPPPDKATFWTDPRIEACQATFPAMDRTIPAFEAMHPMGARLSQECVTMMCDAMCTPLFHNRFRVPSYQDWVDTEADWGHVYDFHKRQLQHLQWGHRGERWVLKTGAHMWGLEHLLKTYPDARIVFTHRDPVKSLTSYASLTTLVRTMTSEHVDGHEVARDWSPRLKRALEHVIAVRDAKAYPEAIYLDVKFPDFARDQFAVVRQIYDAFGLTMTDEGATRMKAYIADNPKGKHGVHEYTPEQYGISPEAVRGDFKTYIGRFDLRPE